MADFLPRAAALYKAQVAKGLEGDRREAAKARIVLKPEALLQVVGLKAVGNDYMEVRICHSSGKNFSSSALAR